MSAGQGAPSRILRKLAAYPRQKRSGRSPARGEPDRARAVHHRIAPRRRHAAAGQVGLNKGEAHYAVKNAPGMSRHGEIRDRTTEGQHYRIAGLNLLTAIIVD